MLLEDYLKRYQGKNIYVLGLGVSNIPLCRLLLSAGLKVTACDRTPAENVSKEVRELAEMGAELRLGPDYLKDAQADVVFRTPVMLPTIPEIKMFSDKGAEITSEMELFFKVCPAHIIAITGSDGKTTTTTLISKFLEADGKKVYLGGNIGTPLLPLTDEMKPEDYAVVELSSFQLMDMHPQPEVAVITNVSPNHLDKHADMTEYVNAKKNIYKYQCSSSKTVLNLDNQITALMIREIPGSAVTFSRSTDQADVTISDGFILCGDQRVLKVADILLPGSYNVENYMAAIAAVQNIVSPEAVQKVASVFTGVEHRMELVRVLNGIRFYNDSIASSPNRSIAGLSSFDEKVIMIAGGYDKHVPFDALGPVICRKVKKLVLTGDTSQKIFESVRNAADSGEELPDILKIDDFYEAVRTAYKIARPGDSVLLSPAGPAFDKFKNFAVRGNEFKRTVMDL